MKIKRIVLTFTLLAVAVGMSFLFTPDTVDRSATVEDNIVSTPLISGDRGSGAGILLNSTDILTAAHVLKDNGNMFVHFADDPNIKHKFRIINMYNKNDLAILRLEKSPGIRPAVVFCATPEIGTQVYSIGDPFQRQWMVRWGYVASKSGILAPEMLSDSDIVDYFKHTYTLDSHLLPGNSGGGIFDANNGAVVGMIGDISVEQFKQITSMGLSVMTLPIGIALPHQPEQLCSYLDDKKIGFYRT